MDRRRVTAREGDYCVLPDKCSVRAVTLHLSFYSPFQVTLIPLPPPTPPRFRPARVLCGGLDAPTRSRKRWSVARLRLGESGRGGRQVGQVGQVGQVESARTARPGRASHRAPHPFASRHVPPHASPFAHAHTPFHSVAFLFFALCPSSIISIALDHSLGCRFLFTGLGLFSLSHHFPTARHTPLSSYPRHHIPRGTAPGRQTFLRHSSSPQRVCSGLPVR